MLSATVWASALRSRMRTLKTATGFPLAGSMSVSYTVGRNVEGTTSMAVRN
ncbi:hypothetical protein [Streptomyces sp. NK08204]|uniref:hypothetical protein n=1 Tax=Streptomyces sp. NK08204 TaxID=2873260 RepID=UPI001CEDE3E1|nr:hypothetical protein [Streptomyces sp. NK08204]